MNTSTHPYFGRKKNLRRKPSGLPARGGYITFSAQLAGIVSFFIWHVSSHLMNLRLWHSKDHSWPLFSRADHKFRLTCISWLEAFFGNYPIYLEDKFPSAKRLTLNILQLTITTKIYDKIVSMLVYSDATAIGNVFKKLKHGSIINGCWNIHWIVHLLEQQVHTSVDISTTIDDRTML